MNEYDSTFVLSFTYDCCKRVYRTSTFMYSENSSDALECANYVDIDKQFDKRKRKEMMFALRITCIERIRMRMKTINIEYT